MDKYIVKGRGVGVVYASGYGGGWGSNATSTEMMEFVTMDKEIVQAVINGENEKAHMIACKKFPSFYGDPDSLDVWFVSQGEDFRIEQYDGMETIILLSETDFLTA